MLLGSKADVKKSVELLEDTLISYQQISFQKFLDAIFVSLIIGYFTLEKLDEVMDTFKRYRKLTHDITPNEENDITICAFYYATQWIKSRKKQYADKLEHTLERSRTNDLYITTTEAIEELIKYYNIPCQINKKGDSIS